MNILKLPVFFLFVAMLIASCTSDPKSDEAEVSKAKEVKQVESEEEYEINTNESEVAWVGTKPTGRHAGTFPITNGNIEVKSGKIVSGQITIDLANLQLTDENISKEDEQKLKGHLKSPDFFDVENHPKAEFVITSVESYKKDEDASQKASISESEGSEFKIADPTHKITGNLTMRGETKSIAFPAKVMVSDDKIKAEAKFNIDRTDWGVSYGDESKATDKAKDKFIYNKVNVGLDIIASN